MKKVTIEDISQATGLSRGTVSRAINDRPDISKSTRELVLRTCRDMNYVPHPAARTLATGRSYAVAVLVTDITSADSARFVRGALAAADEAAYTVQIVELGTEPETARRRIAALAPVRTDGLLIHGDWNDAEASALTEAIPSARASTTSPVPGLESDLVGPDFAEAGRLAARRLCESGVDRVALLDDHAVPGSAQIRAGFSEVCEQAGATCSIFEASEEDARGAARACESAAGLPAAVGVSDAWAIRVRWANRGLARVIGIGNSAICNLVDPPLTSVDLSWVEIGRRAFQVLVQRIGGERHDAPLRVAVAPRIVVRGGI